MATLDQAISSPVAPPSPPVKESSKKKNQIEKKEYPPLVEDIFSSFNNRGKSTGIRKNLGLTEISGVAVEKVNLTIGKCEHDEEGWYSHLKIHIDTLHFSVTDYTGDFISVPLMRKEGGKWIKKEDGKFTSATRVRWTKEGEDNKLSKDDVLKILECMKEIEYSPTYGFVTPESKREWEEGYLSSQINSRSFFKDCENIGTVWEDCLCCMESTASRLTCCKKNLCLRCASKMCKDEPTSDRHGIPARTSFTCPHCRKKEAQIWWKGKPPLCWD